MTDNLRQDAKDVVKGLMRFSGEQDTANAINSVCNEPNPVPPKKLDDAQRNADVLTIFEQLAK